MLFEKQKKCFSFHIFVGWIWQLRQPIAARRLIILPAVIGWICRGFPLLRAEVWNGFSTNDDIDEFNQESTANHVLLSSSLVDGHLRAFHDSLRNEIARVADGTLDRLTRRAVFHTTRKRHVRHVSIVSISLARRSKLNEAW